MKKLIDSDISKLITSFNVPTVYVDSSKSITWDQYMEMYAVMKTCMEQKRPVCVVDGTFNDPTKIDNITVILSVPYKLDDNFEVTEDNPFFSFYFNSGIVLWKSDDGYKIDGELDYAYGWYPNDSELGIKGTGNIQEWL